MNNLTFKEALARLDKAKSEWNTAISNLAEDRHYRDVIWHRLSRAHSTAFNGGILPSNPPMGMLEKMYADVTDPVIRNAWFAFKEAQAGVDRALDKVKKISSRWYRANTDVRKCWYDMISAIGLPRALFRPPASV